MEQPTLASYSYVLVILDNDIQASPEPVGSTAPHQSIPPTDRMQPVIFPLIGERWLIGRDDDCQIRARPECSHISRRHATISRAGSHFLIEDHSRFGTLINGQPLQRPQVLIPGDMIGLASTRDMLRFEDRESEHIPPYLTDREFEILILLAAGKVNKEIATDLAISPLTVNTYLKRIYEKLGVHSRTEAVNTARYYRLI